MKKLFILLLCVSQIACNGTGGGSGGTAKEVADQIDQPAQDVIDAPVDSEDPVTENPGPEVIVEPEPVSCAGYAILGKFKASYYQGMSQTDWIEFKDDCTFTSTYCGGEYKISGVTDPTFASAQNVTVEVLAHDSYLNECLRIDHGNYTCQVRLVYDAGLQKNRFSMNCDANVTNQAWFR